MYFDIALHYHTTKKVKQHEQTNKKRLKKGIITAPHRLPSHTGPGHKASGSQQFERWELWLVIGRQHLFFDN